MRRNVFPLEQKSKRGNNYLVFGRSQREKESKQNCGSRAAIRCLQALLDESSLDRFRPSCLRDERAQKQQRGRDVRNWTAGKRMTNTGGAFEEIRPPRAFY